MKNNVLQPAKKELEEIEIKIRELKKRLNGYPPGYLRINNNNGYIQ